MNDIQKKLLYQVSQVLFNEQENIPLSDDVLAEARAQTVSSLLTNDYQAIAKNIRCIAAHAELTELMKGIPYTTFKGYVSARYYPIPERREMGDVDFIVSPEYYQEAVNRLLQAGWSTVKQENERHEAFRRWNIYYELHTEIKGIPNNEVDGIKTQFMSVEAKVRMLLADLVETAATVETQQGLIVIPDEFHHGLIMLLHVAGHMVNDGGIGLRHLCDWAVYVHRVDLEKYRDQLENIGLWTFACQLTAVSSVYLGLPDKKWAGEWPKCFLENLMDDILEAGNFGRKQTGRSGIQKIKHSSLSGYIKQRVPLSREYPLLLPFAGVFYAFRYIMRVITGRTKIMELSALAGVKKRQRLYDQFQLFNTKQRVN